MSKSLFSFKSDYSGCYIFKTRLKYICTFGEAEYRKVPVSHVCFCQQLACKCPSEALRKLLIIDKMLIKVKTNLNSIEKGKRNPPAYLGSCGKHTVL